MRYMKFGVVALVSLLAMASLSGCDWMIGPPGEDGETGAQGEQGAVGVDGEAGEPGAMGERGIDALSGRNATIEVSADLISIDVGVTEYFRGGSGEISYAMTLAPLNGSRHRVSYVGMGIINIMPRDSNIGATVVGITATDEDGYTATANLTIEVE